MCSAESPRMCKSFGNLVHVPRGRGPLWFPSSAPYQSAGLSTISRTMVAMISGGRNTTAIVQRLLSAATSSAEGASVGLPMATLLIRDDRQHVGELEPFERHRGIECVEPAVPTSRDRRPARVGRLDGVSRIRRGLRGVRPCVRACRPGKPPAPRANRRHRASDASAQPVPSPAGGPRNACPR